MKYPEIDKIDAWVLSKVLITQAQALGNRPAITFIDGEKWTYANCLTEARNTASVLSRLRIKTQDKVVVMVEDPADFCRLWFGLSLLGAVMVAINTGLKGKILEHQITNSSPALVVADSACSSAVTEAVESTSSKVPVKLIQKMSPSQVQTRVSYQPFNPQTQSSDLACIMYTSGTSGPSKGVMMPEAHCFMFALGTIENQNLRSSDTFYISLPLFHANGLYMQLYPCLIMGAKAVIRTRFSASNWLKDIRIHNATHTNLLGATAAFVVAQPETPEDQHHQLRVIGAAPLPEQPEKILRNRFGVKDVLPLYGMTEVNIPLYGKLGESAPGTCGKVYSRWFEVEIRDPNTDLPVQDGTVGEIMVRPRQPFCFMSGYANMPDKTIEAWRSFWFHTGDAARKRDDGYFVFVDRIKDSIRRRGENISSYEVEQALLGIEGITEIAAYGVPATMNKKKVEGARSSTSGIHDSEGMEDEVMVAIQLTPGHKPNPREIHQIALETLPGFAVPGYIRFLDTLPKTATGKIQKVVLKKQGVTADTWDALVHK